MSLIDRQQNVMRDQQFVKTPTGRGSTDRSVSFFLWNNMKLTTYDKGLGHGS